jgi:pilus assembly protein CpaB
MKIPKLRRLPLQLNRNWAVFGAALALGVVAALGARSYLAPRVDPIEARAKVATVDVVVARTALAAGTKLSRENVAVRQIPKDYAHSTAIAPADFERVEGRSLAYAVRPGEMIFLGLMESKRAPIVSARVKAGRRALAVPVDEINPISGLPEPDDLIDLLASSDRNGQHMVRALREPVRVVATGQRSVDDPNTGERRQYLTVTLDTTPEQAQAIIVARQAGKLTALLRNPQDEAHTGQRDRLAAAPRAARPRRIIPILYGTGTRQLPPGALNLFPQPAPARSTPAASAAPPGVAVPPH